MPSKKILLVGAAAATLCGLFAVAAYRLMASQASSKSLTMEFAGRTRRYILHVPPHHDATKPAALVIVLHGATQSPESAERMSRMSELANKNDFIAVYPSGTGRDPDAKAPTWNAGNCCGYAMLNHVDDVGFLNALIAKLEREDEVDPKRVYATGISNGAMMSYRLACELSDKVAAIAPVEGAQNVECKPAKRVSVLVFHGTSDRLVPFDGGSTPFQVGPRRADTFVAATIKFWVRKDGARWHPNTPNPPKSTSTTIPAARMAPP
ncbi:MAG: PHB depolymerase family esterase [Candidatus Acidiferrum sp.]